MFQPGTQTYIGHILDGYWERHRCLSVLHMTISYQNEFEDGTKTSCLQNRTSKSVELLHSVTLKSIYITYSPGTQINNELIIFSIYKGSGLTCRCSAELHLM